MLYSSYIYELRIGRGLLAQTLIEERPQTRVSPRIRFLPLFARKWMVNQLIRQELLYQFPVYWIELSYALFVSDLISSEQIHL